MLHDHSHRSALAPLPALKAKHIMDASCVRPPCAQGTVEGLSEKVAALEAELAAVRAEAQVGSSTCHVPGGLFGRAEKLFKG